MAIVISAVVVAGAAVYLVQAFGTASAPAAQPPKHANVPSGFSTKASALPSASPSSSSPGGHVLLEQPPAGTQPAVSESAARQDAATEMPSAFGPGGGSVTD